MRRIKPAAPAARKTREALRIALKRRFSDTTSDNKTYSEVEKAAPYPCFQS